MSWRLDHRASASLLCRTRWHQHGKGVQCRAWERCLPAQTSKIFRGPPICYYQPIWRCWIAHACSGESDRIRTFDCHRNVSALTVRLHRCLQGPDYMWLHTHCRRPGSHALAQKANGRGVASLVQELLLLSQSVRWHSPVHQVLPFYCEDLQSPAHLNGVVQAIGSGDLSCTFECI